MYWASTSASRDRPDRPLDGQVLVFGDLEVGLDLDVDLEDHRAVVGQLDGLEVEVGLGDRVELVLLVELLQAGHQQGRLDLVGDLLAEPLLDQGSRGALPGRKPGTWASGGRCRASPRTARRCRRAARRSVTCFLHGPASVICDVEVEPLLGLGSLDGLGVGRRRPAARARSPRCSSTAILPLGVIGLGRLGRNRVQPELLERRPPALGSVARFRIREQRAGDGI